MHYQSGTDYLIVNIQMQNNDNITLGQDLQERLISGIEKVTAVVRQSFGPLGGNVSVESELYPGHGIYNDCQSFLQKIYLDDPIERRGLNFLKELSDKADRISGEGRKTTIIIAEELLKQGFKEKVNGMRLKEELDTLLPSVLESIDKQSQKIEVSDIYKVAYTSSRSKEIGELIQKVYNEIGKDGIIHAEGSGTFDTTYEVSDGVVFQGATWWHPSMVHDEEAQKLGKEELKAIYKKPAILFTKTKIRNVQEIQEFMEVVQVGLKKDLVIFTDDIDLNVLSALAGAHRAKVMNILVIKAPALWRDQVFVDFAKCVGADILEEGSGIDFKNLVKSINDGTFKLGTCEKLVTDGEGTVLTGIEDISAYKNELEAKGDNESKRRLWRLNAKTALLKLGSGSESELSYKLLKTNDALNSCRAALLKGVCEGGAKSLLKASDVLLNNSERQVSQAETIFGIALQSPYNQLFINNGNQELNTEGVYDATIVLENAVKNALSLAGIVLTTKADIRLKEKTVEDYQIEMMQQKRFNFQ